MLKIIKNLFSGNDKYNPSQKASSEVKKKVFVMMSGGVDSSVATSKLKEEGYDVIGVFIKCWSEDMLERLGVDSKWYDNCWASDFNDAKAVAKHLDILLVMWDLREEYKAGVIDYMISEYKQGRTPNPDVMCNGQIKFGVFFEKAIQAGADFVATGHYVKKLEVD